jgi:hypothetical protein
LSFRACPPRKRRRAKYGDDWTGAAQAVSEDGRFGDVELRSVRQHRTTSWDAVVVQGGRNGSSCWTRTSDPAVNSRLLYRLS